MNNIQKNKSVQAPARKRFKTKMIQTMHGLEATLDEELNRPEMSDYKFVAVVQSNHVEACLIFERRQ